MTAITYLGERSFGDVIPIPQQAIAALLLQLQGKLAMLLKLKARLTLTPPSLSANVEIAAKLLAKLQASLSLGLPGASFQLDAAAALMLGIELQIEALLTLQTALGVGVHAYLLHGKAGLVGDEFSAALGSGQLGDPNLTPVYGMAVIANTPAAETSLKAALSVRI